MRISVLTIGAIASILSINSVFATTSTVTSKDYVDAADALKQNKIPATGTNASTPGSTVVTYTSTAGTIGERGIFDWGTDTEIDIFGNTVTTQGHEGDLVTADDFVSMYNEVGDRVRVTTTNRECTEWVANAAHTDANCLLWRLIDQPVYSYGIWCQTNVDCSSLACFNGGSSVCVIANHVCDCVDSFAQ